MASRISTNCALRWAVRARSGRSCMYAFDLLELNGKDLRRESRETRRGALTRLLAKTEGGIRLSEHIDGPDGRRPMRSFGATPQINPPAHRPSLPDRAV